MKVYSKSPKECSKEEINKFIELVQEGGEVVSSGLRSRILNSKKLVFVSEEETWGIGAIKHPSQRYRQGVFRKAGLPEYIDKDSLEIGWIYVDRGARGKGIAKKIMKELCKEIRGKYCFATTRTRNEIVHHLLHKHGFSRVGEECNNSYPHGQYFNYFNLHLKAS